MTEHYDLSSTRLVKLPHGDHPVFVRPSDVSTIGPTGVGFEKKPAGTVARENMKNHTHTVIHLKTGQLVYVEARVEAVLEKLLAAPPPEKPYDARRELSELRERVSMLERRMGGSEP